MRELSISYKELIEILEQTDPGDISIIQMDEKACPFAAEALPVVQVDYPRIKMFRDMFAPPKPEYQDLAPQPPSETSESDEADDSSP